MKTRITTLDPEQLRTAMRAWTSGVTVVTAAYSGEQHGMTVSSFTSISLDPPLIIISLQTASRTYQLVEKARTFGLTILSATDQDLSKRFAGRLPDQEHRLTDVEIETMVTGAPVLNTGLAQFDCRVTQSIPAGMNTIFIAEVVAARGDGTGQPLVYHNRQYHKLAD
ncbi:MAG: flavin reductase family protein [Anaerolineales bacterium]